MGWRQRTVVMTSVVLVALGLLVPTTVGAVPAGDVSSATVPRPPFDSGSGDPITRALFTTPDGSISCRRVYTEMIWLECLLRDSDEILRFGPDEFATEVPCLAPDQTETCRMGFGWVDIRPATKSAKSRFTGARRIPLERLVELGRRTAPYPVCIADPNLGLSCSTMMDDQVGEQIYLGLAGAVWNCPGYEYIGGESAIPRGHDGCRVIRP